MSDLVRIVVLVLMSMLLIAGCATPPIGVTTPAVPVTLPTVRTCGVCRWIDANGMILFTKCGVPAGTPVEGWELSEAFSCDYRQQAPANP
jgi:TRAP-type C4-dicarboxylate transport system permease large subunit